MFASAYGWGLTDVLNMTFPEVFKQQESMLRRLRRLGQKPGNDGNINWEHKKPTLKLHDALDNELLRGCVVEE